MQPPAEGLPNVNHESMQKTTVIQQILVTDHSAKTGVGGSSPERDDHPTAVESPCATPPSDYPMKITLHIPGAAYAWHIRGILR